MNQEMEREAENHTLSYQDLFDYFYDEHSLQLLENEIHEIIRLVNEVKINK